jgi:signal transduction histidine kinase
MITSSSRDMQKELNTLAKRYEAALCRYLIQRPSPTAPATVKLGRKVVSLGLETLDVALIHEKALIKQALTVNSPVSQNRMIKRASLFFAEVITPLEEGHRGAIEANVKLSRMNAALSQQTLDITRSNQQLKKEITRRIVIEKSLLKSEQQSRELLNQSHLLQEKLRLLSRRILLIQEEERKRISRELHDVVAHVLTGINVRLANLKIEASTNAKGLSRKITNTQRLVERSVDIVHRFARELRPAVLDDLGLIPALHSYMTCFSKDSGIRITLTAFAGLELLSNMKRTVLYRIVQEALSNVERHAHASRVDIFIEKQADIVVMRIKDNGQSFDLQRVQTVGANNRLGLLGMRERAEMIGGKLKIASEPGKGTTIQVELPFNKGLKEPLHT